MVNFCIKLVTDGALTTYEKWIALTYDVNETKLENDKQKAHIILFRVADLQVYSVFVFNTYELMLLCFPIASFKIQIDSSLLLFFLVRALLFRGNEYGTDYSMCIYRLVLNSFNKKYHYAIALPMWMLDHCLCTQSREHNNSFSPTLASVVWASVKKIGWRCASIYTKPHIRIHYNSVKLKWMKTQKRFQTFRINSGILLSFRPSK